MELTDKQIELLYDMTEIHYEWFQKSSPDTNIDYNEVLKLNHQKMLDITDSCLECTEEVLDFIFESIMRDYKKMLNQVI